jgi:phytoene synthase
MMTLLMGVRDPECVARACDLGVAMQLSNIARDVGEDARMGRVYLPLSWLREAGIDPDAWLARPVHNEALAAVMRRLLRAADALYDRVDGGVAQLPLACRPGINAARLLYAEIGQEVRRRGLDSVSRRAVVPASRKAWLLARAMVGLFPAQRGLAVAPMAATKFLVDAVAEAAPQPPRAAVPVPSLRGLDGRVAWVVDLFERLERRDQLLGSVSAH